MENLDQAVQVEGKKHQWVGWLLLGGLFILRIPFLTTAGIVGSLSWEEPFFQVETYLLTALLIYWERRNLVRFHIDRISLFIIILFKPIQTLILNIWKTPNNALAFPKWPSLIVWSIAIGLLLALWLRRDQFPKFTWNGASNLLWGLLTGLLAILLMAYPYAIQFGLPTISYSINLNDALKSFPKNFSYQLGYAAVTEEPFFRGFLWGYLTRLNWKAKWIWLFQAFLFSIGHLYYIDTRPILFWIVVPFAGLFLGALVWRTKTITSSMVAHATLNSLAKTAGLILDKLIH